MQAYDNKVLWERLNELAEVFDKKPVSEKGLSVWFNVLREHPTEKVCSVLLSWPKTHTKFPAPSEVWKAVNEISIVAREKQAAMENRQEFYPGVGGEKAEEFIAKIREILKSPKWSPTEHWQRNLERFPSGHIGHIYAVQALTKKGMIRSNDPREEYERVAGQDDEERQAVNF